MTFLKNEGVEIVQDSENRLTVIKMLHKPREGVHTSQHRTEKQIQCGRGGEEDPRKVMNKLHCAASWYRYPAAFLRIAGHNYVAALFRSAGESVSRVNPHGELFPLVRGFDEIFGAMPARPDDRPSTAASESHLLQVSPPGLRSVPRLFWGWGPLSLAESVHRNPAVQRREGQIPPAIFCHMNM